MTSRVASFVRLAIMLGATAPLAATAAEAASDDGLLDEIVVTAQKREESLRDVPLSVEAVSGDKLADVGIVRLDDLKAYVPNLQMTETGIANNIYIRGIGSGLNQGFEQSVSLYQDGIYRGRGHQSRLPFLDLARIEVLRGPQPILFGKNAVAGAVNMVAARPTREFEGSVRGSRDFENDDTVASLMLSGPINDYAAVRVAVHHRNAEGYVQNATLNRERTRCAMSWARGSRWMSTPPTTSIFPGESKKAATTFAAARSRSSAKHPLPLAHSPACDTARSWPARPTWARARAPAPPTTSSTTRALPTATAATSRTWRPR